MWKCFAHSYHSFLDVCPLSKISALGLCLVRFPATYEWPNTYRQSASCFGWTRWHITAAPDWKQFVLPNGVLGFRHGSPHYGTKAAWRETHRTLLPHLRCSTFHNKYPPPTFPRGVDLGCHAHHHRGVLIMECRILFKIRSFKNGSRAGRIAVVTFLEMPYLEPHLCYRPWWLLLAFWMVC